MVDFGGGGGVGVLATGSRWDGAMFCAGAGLLAGDDVFAGTAGVLLAVLCLSKSAMDGRFDMGEARSA